MILDADGAPTGVRGRRLENGRFHILGRADRRIELNHRILDLDAAEDRLREAPALDDAALIEAGDGEGGQAVRAYLKPRHSSVDQTEFMRLLRSAFASLPLGACFVSADPIPRDSWGWSDGSRLDRLTVEPLQRGHAPARPSSPRLAALRELWAAMLDYPAVGDEDNFFDLGGTSLTAVQIFGRVRGVFGADIEIADFFAAPTVAGLDALIDRAPPVEPQDHEPALTAVPRDPPPRLSFSQERLWFLDQFQPETPFYNVAEVLRLGSQPDASALRQALDRLAARHEALRTTFPRINGAPVQLIHPPAPAPLKMRVLHNTQAALDEAVAEETWRPFDLESGPLFRATLLQPAGGEALVLLALHHIITDAWSMRMLKREILALYDAARSGFELNPPAPVLQYADYAAWERRRLYGPKLDALTAHWREVLESAPTTLQLPADRPRPAHQSFAGRAQMTCLPRETAERLRARARAAAVTPFVVYLTAFAALLHRLTGQTDLLIGTPVLNRHRPELEQICGLFANTVVIRSRAEPGDRMGDLLDRIGRTVLSALRHAELPFEKLVEDLQPQRDPSRNPLFQAMFVHEDRRREDSGEASAGARRDAADATLSDHRTAKFDLTLQIIEDGGGLVIAAEYATVLFDDPTVALWLEYQRRLLTALADQPDSEIHAVPLLAAEALAAVTAETPAPHAPPLLHDFFDRQAAATPNAVAVEDSAGSMTYAELDRAAVRLARRLVAEGIGPGAAIGVLVERSSRFAVAVLAALKAGGACLVLDPQYPQARLVAMLEDAQPAIILAESPLDWLAAGWTCLLLAGTTAPRSVGGDWPQPSPNDPAYIVFTSGSTGRPKGIVMPHRALTNLMAWQLRQSGLPAPCTLQFAPLSFDVAFQEMFATWGGGGRLVFITEAERRDPAAILARIEAAGVERIYLPYIALDQLAQAVRRRGRAPASLRTVITAGEALKITPDIAAWFAESPACRLFNQYGPAETHVVTEEPLEGPPSAWPTLPAIGRPIAGAAVFVADGDLRPVPPGVAGEIVVAGRPLALGYLRRPEDTSARFARLPQDGRTIYRTGDLGRLDAQGRLVFLGRADQQMKIRGFRVEPGEIEAALKAVPGVADAVVIARGDSAVERYLAAYVVPANGLEAFDPEAAHAALRLALPEPMRPAQIIAIPEIPLTPSGKQDRAALARISAPSRTARQGQAPRSKLERRIADIWRDVLHGGEVGVNDNFFEVGGHSLSATRLVAQLSESFRVEVPVRAVFDAPTIEALSREIVVLLAADEPQRDEPPAGTVLRMRSRK